MRKVTLSARADRELRDLLRWTEAQWGTAQKERYKSLLAERFLLLATEPELGREFEPARPGLLQARAGEHTVFYRVKRTELLIVSVMHGRQDHSTRLGRRKGGR